MNDRYSDLLVGTVINRYSGTDHTDEPFIRIVGILLPALDYYCLGLYLTTDKEPIYSHRTMDDVDFTFIWTYQNSCNHFNTRGVRLNCGVLTFWTNDGSDRTEMTIRLKDKPIVPLLTSTENNKTDTQHHPIDENLRMIIRYLSEHFSSVEV